MDKSDVDIAVYGCEDFARFSLDVEDEVWTLLKFDQRYRPIFVYNNRIRKYDLITGELVDNRAMRKARWKDDSGTDVIKKFISPA